MIPSRLDRFLLNRFRRIHTHHTGQQSPAEGHDGLMAQVRQELMAERPGVILDLEVAVLADFLGPVGNAVRRVVRLCPRLAAKVVALLVRIGFRGVVGPMRSGGGTAVEIPRCAFLAAGGQDACTFVCKRPAEHYFPRYLGLPTTLSPDYATGHCRIVVGGRTVRRR